MSDKFVHNGVTITLTGGGAFTAIVGGKTIMAPSLPAMRKKLDKAAEFESFPAFVHGYGGQVKRFRVTAVRNNPRKSYWEPLLFVCDDGENRSRVYPDTPENNAAHAAYDEARKAFEAARAPRQTAARDQVETRRAQAGARCPAARDREMTPRNRMAFILATAAGSLLASTGSGRVPLPEIQQQSREPPRPVIPRDPVDTLSRRQRKRERIKERQRAAAGVGGSKLAKKAARGKL